MQLPFEIPTSLAIYAEQFEDDPVKATTKLKKHLRKRGPDAVGHFLLAWFYYVKGLRDEAVRHALKAKTYAPGSPFFEKLHYYFAHPQNFEAWTPEDRSAMQSTGSLSDPVHADPLLDLDALIERLSSVESTRISSREGLEGDGEAPDLSEGSKDIDEIASETLAEIHKRQGKIGQAIQTYKRLIRQNPSKKDRYENQITRLKAQREKEKEESGKETRES